MEAGRKSLGGRSSDREKFQVIYYLTRNGQLEHPHFMEVHHGSHRHLRLRDVMDRLMVLRGRSMPSLYSWSCKRCYKNGYVWNDLAENDVVYPSEGGEYVLKGTELMEITAEKLQKVQLSGNPKRCVDGEEDEDRTLRISKGVSTDEVEELQKKRKEMTTETESSPPPPPSSTSSAAESNPNSKRFEEDDTLVTADSTPARASTLFQFFCGSSAGGRHRIAAVRAKNPPARLDEEDDEICCMSLNPRFGNAQAEAKEFFSGSMAEAMIGERAGTEARLVRSSSCKEERIAIVEEDEKKGMPPPSAAAVGRRRCVPRMMCSEFGL